MSCGCGCVNVDTNTRAMMGLSSPSCSRVGDLLPTIVWPSDVDAYKRKLDPQFSATNAIAQTCAKLPPASLAAWSKEYAAWQSFSAEATPTFGSANKYDEAKAYEQRLSSWQDLLTAAGCKLASPKNTPPPDSGDVFKWVAAAAIVVAVVYGARMVLK